MFTVNIGDGRTFEKETVGEAKKCADDHASLTGADIVIHNASGGVVAFRPWVPFGRCFIPAHDPLIMDDFGYYADWMIA